MMEELLNRLYTADKICRQANDHFVQAQQLLEQANQKKVVELRSKKKIAILAGVIAPIILEQITHALFSPLVRLLPLLSGIFSILNLVVFWGSIGIVVAVYFAYKKKLERECMEAEQQAALEQEAGQKILQEHQEELSVIPVDCLYPLATEYLIKMLESGRAETLKEALQLFDEQLHRWNMEASYANILAEQQRQTQYLRNIEHNTRETAAAAWFNFAK